MHINSQRKLVSAAGLSAVFLCMYVFMTNPRTLPAPMLLVPPALLFVLCLFAFRLIVGAFTDLNSARIKAVVVALSALPALLLMLATVGQLGAKDAILAILFVGGLTWYFDRSRQNINSPA